MFKRIIALFAFSLIAVSAAFADGTVVVEPGLIGGLVDFVMGNFEGLSRGVQFTVLAVLASVTLAAHIAPYTATTKDDFLFEHKNTFLAFLKRIFNIVSGNYGKAENHGDVMERKAAIKESRNRE